MAVSRYKAPAAARHPATRTVKLVELGVVIVAVTLLAVWLYGSLPNRDLLWLYKSFDAQPSVIRIYYYGQVREITPGQPGFVELVEVINTEIVNHRAGTVSLYPHHDSLTYYQTKGFAVELIYAEPARLHTARYFPPAPVLMIAFDGTFNYTQQTLLFRGTAEGYLPGGVALENVDGVRAAVESLMAEPAATW